MFSAVHLSWKANSAVTFGLCPVTRQLSIGPVVGSSADWMSAAVVPGAKLLPTTTNGPEAPLMDRPPLGCRMVAWAFPDSSALKRRSALCCFLFAGFARVRADATVAGAGWGLGLLVWFGREEIEAERYMTRKMFLEMLHLRASQIWDDGLIIP